jgi:hypothetical protein
MKSPGRSSGPGVLSFSDAPARDQPPPRPRILSHSIFMISAPKAPSQRVAHGPARTQLKSTGECFQGLAVETWASFSCIAVSLSYGAGGR